MMALMDRKVAVITGSASGIGKACLERLLSQGVEVFALDRDEVALARLRATSDGKPLHTLVVDIGSEESVRSSIEQSARSRRELTI